MKPVTSLLYLVHRLRMCGASPPFPCTISQQQKIYVHELHTRRTQFALRRLHVSQPLFDLTFKLQSSVHLFIYGNACGIHFHAPVKCNYPNIHESSCVNIGSVCWSLDAAHAQLVIKSLRNKDMVQNIEQVYFLRKYEHIQVFIQH